MDEGCRGLVLEERDGACILRVRVTPRSSRESLTGVEGGFLRLKVTALPVEGEANEAVRVFLSRLFGLPKSMVMVIKGAASRTKTVRLEGLRAGTLRTVLSKSIPGGRSDG
jgi:hypothetical protein